MYSIPEYGRMIADRVRMGAYLEAMTRVIRPGSVVVDLGAGPGILALHACRLGAARVYAVEPDDSIAVAIELARANGMSDRIRFFQEPAEALELPEPADVIVSDLRGVLPLHGSHLQVIGDVRRRWLRPGGTLIPARDTLRASLVSHPGYHEGLARVWGKTTDGLDLTPVLKWCVNQPQGVALKPEALAVPPQTWCVLDYSAPPFQGEASRLSWQMSAPVTVHGLVLWFDTELSERVGFSNAPGREAAIYGQWFLPWPTPIGLDAGDCVEVDLGATLHEAAYRWQWTTHVRGHGRTERFVQSTFLANPVGPKTLRTRAEDHVPGLTPKVNATWVVLGGIREGLALRDIARRLLSECGDAFGGSFRKALAFAADVGAKHAR